MLLVNQAVREKVWAQLIETLERYATEVDSLRVTPQATPDVLRKLLAPFMFDRPIDPAAALRFATEGMTRYSVHTPHPRYFGLFNPNSTTMGIVADALVAAFNPQAGAWGHSPFAVEVEQHLIRALGSRFGYDPAQIDGTFTSGGSEANHTAVLTALTQAFPEFKHEGLRGLTAQPVFYASAESHHSLLKAARFCGLGAVALREIRTDGELRMKVDELADHIREDRARGYAPFLVVATAGTTSAGAIDPIARIAEVAERERLWLHVDAAWGGAAALVPELRPLLVGIERADSITFDAHKWLSVPMAAGIYFTRHCDILNRTFHVETTYVPKDAGNHGVVDGYAHSMQWARRFIGLKVFLSLAVAGWEGYASTIRHMTAMGDLLRSQIEDSGWPIVNETPLPVVCFVDGQHAEGCSLEYLDTIARHVVASGRAWISTTRLGVRRGAPGSGRPALRACISNFRTGPADVTALVEALGEARQHPASAAV